jgi:hypothetical protein
MIYDLLSFINSSDLAQYDLHFSNFKNRVRKHTLFELFGVLPAVTKRVITLHFPEDDEEDDGLSLSLY